MRTVDEAAGGPVRTASRVARRRTVCERRTSRSSPGRSQVVLATSAWGSQALRWSSSFQARKGGLRSLADLGFNKRRGALESAHPETEEGLNIGRIKACQSAADAAISVTPKAGGRSRGRRGQGGGHPFIHACKSPEASGARTWRRWGSRACRSVPMRVP